MEQLYAILNSLQAPPPGLFNRLSSYLVSKRITKKEYLLEEGETCANLYFIEKGLIRAYYADDKGNQVTTWFMKEGDFICAIESFYEQTPSFENMIAIEDSIVWSITYDQMQALYKEFPAYNLHGRLLTEKYYIRAIKRMISLVKKTTIERYQQLLEQEAYLLDRANQQDIASYLGMTPEMLSRIKKQYNAAR